MNRTRNILMLAGLLLAVLLVADLPASAAPQVKVAPGNPQVGRKPPAGPGAQQTPLAARIEDIDAHRRKPMTLVRSYDEKVKLDLDNVNFDADVVAVVDGFPITRDLFRAYLVMSIGALDVDRFKTAMLSEIGKEVRLADGADPAEFEVSDARVDQEIENQLKQQQTMLKKPELNLEEFKKGIESAFGWDRYREKVRSMVAFEKVYLPEIQPVLGPDGKPVIPEPKKPPVQGEVEPPVPIDPNLPVVTDAQGAEVNRYLPEITWDALSQREKEQGLRDMLNQQYRDKTPIGGFLRPHFAKAVKDALLRSLDVEYFYRGNLKPGILLRIVDKDLPIDEVYEVIKGRVNEDDKKLVLREILLCKSMDRALKEAGCLLTPEEADAEFREHEKAYENTFLPLEYMIQLYGYQDMATYRNLYNRRSGYEKMIADKLNDDEFLKDYYEGAARLLYENGSVKLQCIFFGVYDHATKKIREGGYAWAEERMAEVMKRLAAGEDFGALGKEYMNTSGTFNTHDFQLLNRQNLRVTLGESARSALVSGFSMSDYIFYRAKNDEIVGPVKNSWSMVGNPSHKGIFLFKVKEFRRSQVLKPYDISKPMVVTDFSDFGFTYWANETLKGSKIELTRM